MKTIKLTKEQAAYLLSLVQEDEIRGEYWERNKRIKEILDDKTKD